MGEKPHERVVEDPCREERIDITYCESVTLLAMSSGGGCKEVAECLRKVKMYVDGMRGWMDV